MPTPATLARSSCVKFWLLRTFRISFPRSSGLVIPCISTPYIRTHIYRLHVIIFIRSHKVNYIQIEFIRSHIYREDRMYAAIPSAARSSRYESFTRYVCRYFSASLSPSALPPLGTALLPSVPPPLDISLPPDASSLSSFSSSPPSSSRTPKAAGISCSSLCRNG